MLPPPSQRSSQRLQQQRVAVRRHAQAAAPALGHEHPLRAKTIGAQLTLRSPVRAHCRLVAADTATPTEAA